MDIARNYGLLRSHFLAIVPELLPKKQKGASCADCYSRNRTINRKYGSRQLTLLLSVT